MFQCCYDSRRNSSVQQSWFSPNNYGYSTSSTPTSDNIININNHSASTSRYEETAATTEHFATFPQDNINVSTATALDVSETQNAGNNGTPAVGLTGSDENTDNNII